jgi:hypothetical protein
MICKEEEKAYSVLSKSGSFVKLSSKEVRKKNSFE